MFTTVLYTVILHATSAMGYATLCFSNLNVYTEHLEALLPCRVRIRKSVVGPYTSQFSKLPGDAGASDPQITVCVARLKGTERLKGSPQVSQ